MPKDGKKIAIGLGVVAVVTTGIILATRKAEAHTIELSTGWNQITYPGPSKKVEVVFKSIEDYLVLVYYYSDLYGYYLELAPGSWVEPGMLLYINVSQDCTWTF